MGIGPFEILIVLAVLALIVGPRRVTNMAKSLGRGVQEFVGEIGDKKADGPEKRSAIGGGDEKAEEEGNKPPTQPGER